MDRLVEIHNLWQVDFCSGLEVVTSIILHGLLKGRIPFM